MSKQLNIFIENRPGRLKSITGVLSKGNINIRSFTIQDRGDFGVIKLIVDRPLQAHTAIQDAGFACALKEIVAASIPDKPGNMHKLTSILSENNINILDAYGFVLEPNKTGVCCIEPDKEDDLARIGELIEAAGFHIMNEEELYEL